MLEQNQPFPHPSIPCHPSLDEPSAPRIQDQLQSLLELLHNPLPEESATAYRERLTVVANRIAEIAKQVQGAESEKLEVVAANATSAGSDSNDVVNNADAIILNNSRFNRLACDLPTGEVFAIHELAARWVEHQKSGNSHHTITTIKRLADAGVLEYVREDHVQRTDRPLILRRPVDLPQYGDALQPVARPAASIQLELVAPRTIARALQADSSLRDLTYRSNHPFGEEQGDGMRLLAAMVLGLSAIDAGKLWSPPLTASRARSVTLRMTGVVIADLRNSVQQVLVADLVNLLTATISDLAAKESARRSPNNQESVQKNAGHLITALVLAREDRDSARGKVQAAFGLPAEHLPNFVETVLHRAKEPLIQLLHSTQLALMLGARGADKVELIANCVLQGATLTAVGESVGLSRERIRQYRERIAGIHPLVEAIIEAPEPELAGSTFRFTTELLTELSEQIKQDPRDAYRVGAGLDPSHQQLVGEDQTSYLRRIFLAGFAGAYVDGRKSRVYPVPLQHLPDGPHGYFLRLAHQCIDASLRDSIQSFSATLTDEEITHRLTSHGVSAAVMQIPNIIPYLRALVERPTERRLQIVQSSALSLPSSQIEPVFTLIEPIVREFGKVRAERACAVFDELWCAPWLPSERCLGLLSKRIREQLSVAAACSALNMTGPIFSVTWHELTMQLPTVKHLVPRKARSSRTGEM